jgi:uncharacterized protein (DUF934 family)
MTRLIRNQAIIDDDWQSPGDDAPLPSSGRVILSLKRWREARDELKTGDVVVGVKIPNTEDVDTLWPELADRPLIAVEFPAHGDGRAFSQASVLRTRYNYRGEIRAVGDVMRDQIYFMHRCGINAMVPRADQDLAVCLTAFRDFTEPYQGAADGLPPVYVRRRAG